MSTIRPLALMAVTLLTVGACSSGTAESQSNATAMVSTVSASGISADRCEANRKAGKITYHTGYGYAAAASIVEVAVAKDKGYFDQMCLDVDIKPGFATANYALVASNQSQFASAGSYAEVVQNNTDGKKLTAVAIDGNVGNDALLVKPDSGITQPADVKGKQVGVKGALTPSEIAMLVKAGLKREDYHEVSLSGFDAEAQWKLPIDVLPVYKSNEPRILDAAGLKYTMLDPAAYGIPGRFGVIYTNAKFRAEHPSATQDFVRASMRGMADALTNPNAAVAICMTKANSGGNTNGLTNAGETYRWGVESALVRQHTATGDGVGMIHGAALQAEIDTYTQAGVFANKPDLTGTYDEGLVAGIYQGETLIWPGATTSNSQAPSTAISDTGR